MPQMPLRSALFLGLLSICLQASVPVVIRGISAEPWGIGLTRLTFAAAAAWLLFPTARRWAQTTGRERWVLLLLGLTFALHWVTFFFSIKLGSAQLAAIGVSSYGIHVSFLGAWLLKHRTSWTHWVGLSLAIAGTVLVGGGFPEASGPQLFGFGLALLSGFFFALLPVLHQRHEHLGMGIRTFSQYAFGLIVFLPFARQANWELAVESWPGMLYLCTVGTLVAHTLWVKSSSVLPTTHSAIIYYFYVPVAAVLAYVFLGERLGWWQVLGAAAIIGGSLTGLLGEPLRRYFTRETPEG